MSLSMLHAGEPVDESSVADRHQEESLRSDRVGVGIAFDRVDHDGAIDRDALPDVAVTGRRHDHQGMPSLGGLGGRAVDHLGEVLDARERVLHHAGDRDRESEHPGATRHQSPRDRAGPVTEFAGDPADPLAGLFRKSAFVVERVRNGRRGDPRFAGDVLDADRPGAIHQVLEHTPADTLRWAKRFC